MTSRIDELADEAADPFEAGKRMRQVYFTNCKLTNRQLTVDLLKKLFERGVGTHDVESIALKVRAASGTTSPGGALFLKTFRRRLIVSTDLYFHFFVV